MTLQVKQKYRQMYTLFGVVKAFTLERDIFFTFVDEGIKKCSSDEVAGVKKVP